jgi:hypothetical protein
MTGRRIGRLVVRSRASENRGGTTARWLCLCDCGNERVVDGSSLRIGKTRSCGCLTADVARERSTKHGHNTTAGKSPEYGAWASMVGRCTNPNNRSWGHYGGRGIAVCERWMEFENFLADMGNRPSSDHSLDRINNDGGYGPGNCRWATRAEQSRNRRNNRLVTINGRQQCVTDWLAEGCVSRGTFWVRTALLGWTTEEAIATPVRNHRGASCRT